MNRQLELALIEALRKCADEYAPEQFRTEIYTDYRDRELSKETIKKICDSNRPREAFEEMVNDWALDYAIEYGDNELEKEVKSYLDEEELEMYETNKDEAWEFINDRHYFYYNENDFNNEVKVNFFVDTGDLNYDFTKSNILNWYGSNGYGDEGTIDELSPIKWLATQQGKFKELQDTCWYLMANEEHPMPEDYNTSDKFVRSVCQELENLPSHMATLTFLTTMSLFDFFDLQEKLKAEEPLHIKYRPYNSKGNGYVVIDKKAMCGLYDPWGGGGSVLEIELDKDVVLPFKYIWTVYIEGTCPYGYDIDEVYGLCGDCWDGKVKEIKENIESIESEE